MQAPVKRTAIVQILYDSAFLSDIFHIDGPFYRCHPFGKFRAGSEPFATLKDKLREGSLRNGRKTEILHCAALHSE